MNIYAQKGDKIVFLNKNGHEHHRVDALTRGLIPNEVYTVNQMEVGNFRSEVELVEFPGLWFNSVMFEDINGFDRLREKEKSS